MAYYRTSETEEFINPYNFVPVGDYQIKSQADIEGEKFSGKITCKIIAKTPIAVPDASCKVQDPEYENHYQYPFMSVNGKHFIPGSSIRGMIRNVYETITDSCFSTIGDNEIIATRVGTQQAYKPAFLIRENGRWRLYEAQKYMLNVSPDYQFHTTAGTPYNYNKQEKTITVQGQTVTSGDTVYFSICDDPYVKHTRNREIPCGYPVNRLSLRQTATETHRGILYLGETISNKHHESVFEIGNPINDITPEMISRAMKGLDVTHNQYNDKTLNSNLEPDDENDRHYGYPKYDIFKLRGTIPVWYDSQSLNSRGILYLSFAALGRKAYYKTVNDVIDKKNSCSDSNNVCDACSLFGMISNQGCISSHVRFSDAQCLTPDKFGNILTLAELSSPRLTYLQFYTTQGNDYDRNEMTIRGRKYYWHTREYNTINENITKTRRNATVEYADSGAEFVFDVYYENVNLSQLKKLIWSLNLGENDKDGNQLHKIGHGKPLGMGSAKIVVENAVCRQYKNGTYVMSKLPIDTYSFALANQSSDTVQALLKITDFGATDGKHVKYPFVIRNNNRNANGQNPRNENTYASHQWFTHNKDDNNNNHTKRQLLPSLTSNGSMCLKAIGVEPVVHANNHNLQVPVCPDCGNPVNRRPDGSFFRYCRNCSRR